MRSTYLLQFGTIVSAFSTGMARSLDAKKDLGNLHAHHHRAIQESWPSSGEIDTASGYSRLARRGLIQSLTLPKKSADTALCPAKNGTIIKSSKEQTYQAICDTDYPGHDFPFLKVDSFKTCLDRCDERNKKLGTALCVAAIFVPSRAGGSDNCYLKSSLSASKRGNGLVGAIMVDPETTEAVTPGQDLVSTCTCDQGDEVVADRNALPPPFKPGAQSLAVSLIVRMSTLFPLKATSTAIAQTKPNDPREGDAGPGNGVDTPTFTSGFLMSDSPVTSSKVDNSLTISNESPTPVSQVTSSPVSPSDKSPNIMVTYAQVKEIVQPLISGSKLHGPSINKPSEQYYDVASPKGITLANNLLVRGVNSALSTEYGISGQTGGRSFDYADKVASKAMATRPFLSRDGGQGGMIGGKHVFVFCDTGSYRDTTATTPGKFLGFVSSSIAIDVGMNGLKGTPLHLEDTVGEWSDAVGRKRGFAPLTEGEQAYNVVMQGKGQRYALWPDTSIVPLDDTSGILFSPIVYVNVDRATNKHDYTYTGAAALKITIDDDKSGPIATRIVKRMFTQAEISWGCSGGIRSWGPSGVGGNDGYVYLFGNTKGGLLVGRTTPEKIADRSAMQYWTGSAWSPTMLTEKSTAYIITGDFKDIHILYSPRHLTFIIIYLTSYADNTFYIRYLEADQAILPPYAPGGDGESDYVENITKYTWSKEKVLYKAGRSLSGRYIYAGAVHEGYYGEDDLTNGGTKLLISWTAPTGQDPASFNSEYQIVTAEVHFA